MRYTLTWCLFGFSDSSDHGAISPCSEQCDNIADGLKKNMLNASATTPYDYCDGFISIVDVNSCADCYSRINTQFYLSNCKSSCFPQRTRTDRINVNQLSISSIQPVNTKFYPQIHSLSNHHRSSPLTPPPITPQSLRTRMQAHRPVFPVERSLQLASLFQSLFLVSSVCSCYTGICVCTGAQSSTVLLMNLFPNLNVNRPCGRRGRPNLASNLSRLGA